MTYTSQQVRDRIFSVHANQYNFPNIESEYSGIYSLLTGFCHDHGKFQISLNSIITYGSGCKSCTNLKLSTSYRLSPQQVRDKINSINYQNYIFPYIETEYINNKSKLTVICPIHGEFPMCLSSIMRGSNCPKCANIIRGNNQRLSLAKVKIGLLSNNHNYEFPYFESEYHDIYSNITAICKIHGEFLMTYDHISHGCGCQKCVVENRGISKRNVQIQPGLCDYTSYHHRLPITDCPTEGPHGELQVRCKMCQQLFTPTSTQVYNHIRVINQVGQGENNFYCSDKCKYECTMYGKKGSQYPITTDYEVKIKLARNCQLETKFILRKQQFDQYGYHFCEKCGRCVDNPELHHTIEVAKDPSGAITIAGQMLVCSDPCHKEFTARCK